MYRVALCTAVIAELPILDGPISQYRFPCSKRSPLNYVSDYISVSSGSARQRVKSAAVFDGARRFLNFLSSNIVFFELVSLCIVAAAVRKQTNAIFACHFLLH